MGKWAATKGLCVKDILNQILLSKIIQTNKNKPLPLWSAYCGALRPEYEQQLICFDTHTGP